MARVVAQTRSGPWRRSLAPATANCAPLLVANDFFTVEVLTLRGLMTYYVLFFIHLESRRIGLDGLTRHPDEEWMEQMARNGTMEDSGFLNNRR
jgi:hypothetical protein